MTEAQIKPSPDTCPQCGKAVSPASPANSCSHCLMALGMNIDPNIPTAADSRSALDENHIPSVEKLMSVFPQLEIQHLIGHGGMGAVYQARQINLDRIVALKILSPRLACNPAFAERFLREAQTLAKLSHPNIVTVFESGKAGDFYYLAMEFVDGVNLRDTISANLLSPEQALAIIPQVCEALQYAHDHGVIHRDIKPENILIAKDGHVRIADFGLAKMLQPTADQFTLTGTQQVLGTMNYMAPEQIETPSVVDHRADLYSLGVVFYELLTGELPLGRFALPSEKSEGVSHRLDDLVMRTLEKDPDRRYQQASQIKTACEGVGQGQSERRPEAGPNSRPAHAYSNAASRSQPNQSPAGDPTANFNSAKNQNQPFYQRDETKSLCRPFAVTIEEIHGGLASGYGLMRGFETHLELEFEIRDFLDAVKWGAKTVAVPMERIASINLYKGLVYKYLEVQCDQMSAVNDIPNSRQGMFRVYMKSASIASAEELVRCVNELIKDMPNSQGSTAVNSPQPPVKQGKFGLPIDSRFNTDETEISYFRDLLKFPRIMLGVAGTLMMLFLLVMVYCSVEPSWLGRMVDGQSSDLPYVLQQNLIDLLDDVVSTRESNNSGQMLDFRSWNPIMLMIIPAAMALLCFLCANRIKRFRDYPFVLMSMFALMLPIHPLFVLSAPFAVWILFILVGSNVRRVFRAHAVAANGNSHRMNLWGESSNDGEIVRSIGMFLIFGAGIFFAAVIILVSIYLSRQNNSRQIPERPVNVQTPRVVHPETPVVIDNPNQSEEASVEAEAQDENFKDGEESMKDRDAMDKSAGDTNADHANK